MRYFSNGPAPIIAEDHYLIPPFSRLDLEELRLLIGQKKYFVLHAPRQTGKTTLLLALRDKLNSGRHHRCVYVNVEVGQSAREDVGAAMRAILGNMAGKERTALGTELLQGIWPEALKTYGPHEALHNALGRWAEADAKPLVLLIDEIDSLIGDTLIAVLRQLRAGYPRPPPAATRRASSSAACATCVTIAFESSAENALVLGGSAFNIQAESLRLGDFSRAEVRALLAQHTQETGQAFTEEALADVWRLTCGQPWLVNALAYLALFPTTQPGVTAPSPSLRGHRRGEGATHRAPRNPSGSTRPQAGGGAGAPGGGAVVERGIGDERRPGGRHSVWSAI